MTTSNDIINSRETQYRYPQYTSDQLFRSLGVDWRRRAAAHPPVARDHVTITGLSDGRVLKRDNLTICSVRDVIWRTQAQSEFQPTEHVTVGVTAYRRIHNKRRSFWAPDV